MTLSRPLFCAALIASAALPSFVFAQAPPTAPLVLTVPASARATALAGAWVAGRDQDVIFVNPAQLIGARTDAAVTLARFSPEAHGAAFASALAAGKWSFTLGWGVQAINFEGAGATPPFPHDALIVPGVADAQTAVATVGGAIQYKSFKIGGAAKYAFDRTAENHAAFLADLGVARNMLGGTLAFAAQNLGADTLDALPLAKLPRQISYGYSAPKSYGALDYTFFAQMTHRSDWTSPAGGVEINYSWIEGYAVTGRVGLRRPEIDAELPLSLGAALTADRVTVEYAIRLFDDSRRAHVVTLRWR